MNVPRVTPQEIRGRVQAGEVLFVCAYDDEEQFRSMHLEGAISRQQFRDILPTLSKEKEIVFYCA